MKIDKHLLDIDKNICKNIDLITTNGQRGFFSQNILNELRNFVEHLAIKIYNHDNSSDLEWDYSSIKNIGLPYIRSKSQYKFIAKFHQLLQPSASHYTLDEGCSERLMLKYYEYLLRIRNYMEDTYGFSLLENLGKFPIYQDTVSEEYYSKIVIAINEPKSDISFNERYYIQKIKPFFINQRVYYEVTYTTTEDSSSKFDRITAYTDKEILSNYATKLHIRRESVSIYGEELSILVVADWEVSVRPCEFNNMRKILKISGPDVSASHKEYRILMAYMKEYGVNLNEILDLPVKDYDNFRSWVGRNAQTLYIFEILDTIREITLKKSPGTNVLRYLLFHLNNKVLKEQYKYDRHELNKCDGGNKKLSGLRLDWGCIPFDEMPFCTSLKNHNPKLYDLLECIDSDGRDHEFLARFVRNATEIDGHLYTPIKSLSDKFHNIEELIKEYNSKLIPQHANRWLISEKGHIYLYGYEMHAIKVIDKLREFSTRNNANHGQFVQSWLEKEGSSVDDDYKREKLVSLFGDSAVSLIYGAAGTGKTYFLNHIAQLFNSSQKLFLAVTHTAVENLRRRITAANCEFNTVASATYSQSQCDILFVDECSTVSNEDMSKILDGVNCKFLVLVGDIYQIESIQFGNWFHLAKTFVKKSAVTELEDIYRTEDKDLKAIWSKFRKLDDDILEYLTRYGYTHGIDNSIFQRSHVDEIILSLNYDGLYGINNINRLLQAANPNPSVEWNSKLYKVGDPIVFNDSTRFSGLLYNNIKGIIRKIEEQSDGTVLFDIELIDKQLSGIDVYGHDLELVEEYLDTTNSVVRFRVNRYRSTDEDISDNSTVVPFQISYCISIHRAQGLEYESVKIIISNEIDEQVTHNILYTAITRTKKSLKIYWSPETEKRILENLTNKWDNKDGNFLRQKLE